MEESRELQFERFGLFGGVLLEADLLVGANGEGGEILPGVIEREVLVWLEEAELADFFGGDAAGGKVCDATVLELETDVGDIGFGGEDLDAGGLDGFDGAAGEG